MADGKIRSALCALCVLFNKPKDGNVWRVNLNKNPVHYEAHYENGQFFFFAASDSEQTKLTILHPEYGEYLTD